MSAQHTAGHHLTLHSPARTTVIRILAALAVLLTFVALGGVLFSGPTHEAAPTTLGVRGVTPLVYPATLVSELQPPGEDGWTLPAAAIPVGESTFVLDTGRSRILRFDAGGRLTATYDATTDPRLVLRQPMAMVTDGEFLYIANSLASEVLVVRVADGRVDRAIAVAAQSGREKAPRIIGVALLTEGRIAVSDADNHRVLILAADGKRITTIGTGNRASGKDGFNVPGAIAAARGHLYVVDTLNGRVVEVTESGEYVTQYGTLGRSAGGLQRPKGVAVDAAGRVLISDGLGSVVNVFAPNGNYLGMIGRTVPDDPGSMALFRAPAAIWLAGDRLYVTDRIAGVFVLALTDPAHAPGAGKD